MERTRRFPEIKTFCFYFSLVVFFTKSEELWVQVGDGGARGRAVAIVTCTQINPVGSVGISEFNSVSALFITSFQEILTF